MKRLISLLVLLTLSHFNAHASDHIDGVPSLTKHEQVDLTDLYIFQNGQTKRNTSIILNLYPGVGESGHFSKKVEYNLILRPTLINSPSLKLIETEADASVTIHCQFTDPGHHHANNQKSTVLCRALNKQKVLAEISGNVGQIVVNNDESLKIYTGPRSDAFFITREHFDGVTKRIEFVSADAENLMERINVLSIVLEVDMKILFPENSKGLFALAAESLTNEGGSSQVLDRVGRPEITNLSLHAFNGAKKLKRKYNQTQAFENNSPFYEEFKQRLTENISAYDLLDQTKDWDNETLETLTALLLEDYLVFNSSSNCISLENDYLELEKALLLGVESQSCGGRKVTDDIMNTLYSLYIGGLSADKTSFLSGANKPYQNSSKEVSSVFPYLAEPEEDSFFNIKQKLLNTVLKASQE